ncbi:tRNA (pseudouridine(54)-N(1))-methyltransferase TrmY [Candidatus Acetothermia bacterium]|nr:tRNA (pseudouridine(54)-N(1))-methyltransferase TrmY [Candidatus Acetothermia bacterium]MBI3660587.1 tRNA (pseudouridine(54)-N(1))-methyltransferase TrmY [Candidatus Acetothermia bacterium]
MRTFVILAHKAPLTHEFSLNDLPGGAGRIDVLCRCVTASFCLSHGIRKDVQVYLVFQNQLVVRLHGETLRHLNPDERSTAALLQKALKAQSECVGEQEVQSTSGIFVSRRGLPQLLEQLQSQNTKIIQLHEAGAPLRNTVLPTNCAFLLSDHLEFDPAEDALLSQALRLNLGPKSLHADHCITIVHNELDLREIN